MANIETWTIKNLVDVAKTRQKNEFDVILFWSGSRGNGKSSGSFKFCNRFESFKPWKHIVYSRRDVMMLMESEQYHAIMDDEAVRSGYKRNFYEQDQKKLIAMLNMYRDNFNVYSGCIPNFYDLDKDLRSLCTMHIHVIRRGVAVVHLPKKDILYSNDPWDVSYNAKVESKWYKKLNDDPNFSPPFHKLTTFAGYLCYNALTPQQEVLYKEIKRTKRKAIYEYAIKDERNSEEIVYDNVLDLVKKGFMNIEKLKAIALANGIKYTALRNQLNHRLRNEPNTKPLSSYIGDSRTNDDQQEGGLSINHSRKDLPFEGEFSM